MDLKHGGESSVWGGPGQDPRSWVLDQLKFTEGFLWEAKDEEMY